MKKRYTGPERRQFLRLDFVSPLAYKVCKKKTISKILQGYTSNISQAGLLCNIKEKIKKGDILWLSFDRNTLNICENLEKRSLIYQNGIIGKVVRIKPKKNHTFNVGIQFITREEKNSTHIYPKIYFLKNQKGFLQDETEEEPKESNEFEQISTEEQTTQEDEEY